MTPTAWSWWCRDGWRSATPSRCCTRSGCGSSRRCGCARWSKSVPDRGSRTAGRCPTWARLALRVSASPGRVGLHVARRGFTVVVRVGEAGEEAVRDALERWYRKRRARLEVAWRLDDAVARAGTGYRRLSIPRSADPLGQLLVLGRDELQLAPPARPEEILAYVIEHEVAHLAVLDHSPRFWRLLARRAPLTASTSAGSGITDRRCASDRCLVASPLTPV